MQSYICMHKTYIRMCVPTYTHRKENEYEKTVSGNEQLRTGELGNCRRRRSPQQHTVYVTVEWTVEWRGVDCGVVYSIQCTAID